MKKLTVLLVIVLFAMPAMAQWAIETKDGEVATTDEITAIKTETVVTQRLSKAMINAEIKDMIAQKERAQARIAEINARLDLLRATKELIDASKVTLKPVEPEPEPEPEAIE